MSTIISIRPEKEETFLLITNKTGTYRHLWKRETLQNAWCTKWKTGGLFKGGKLKGYVLRKKNTGRTTKAHL